MRETGLGQRRGRVGLLFGALAFGALAFGAALVFVEGPAFPTGPDATRLACGAVVVVWCQK